MLYMTTSDEKIAFDFTYPTPDDELHNQILPPCAQAPRPWTVAAARHVQTDAMAPVATDTPRGISQRLPTPPDAFRRNSVSCQHDFCRRHVGPQISPARHLRQAGINLQCRFHGLVCQ